MMRIRDWFPIAYHEAAHAAATIALDGFVERAFLHKDYTKPYVDRRGRERYCVGMVEANFYSPLGLTRKGLPKDEKERDLIVNLLSNNMKREIVMCLAGPWAEGELCLTKEMSKEDRRWNLRLFGGGRDDYERVGMVLKDLQAITGRGALRRFEDQAWAFVCTQRDAITDVARLLVEKEEVQHKDIAEICAQHCVTIVPRAIQLGPEALNKEPE